MNENKEQIKNGSVEQEVHKTENERVNEGVSLLLGDAFLREGRFYAACAEYEKAGLGKSLLEEKFIQMGDKCIKENNMVLAGIAYEAAMKLD